MYVLTRTGDEDTKREFVVEEDGSDIISSAVHERNLQVEERLDIQIEIIESSDSRHDGTVINQMLVARYVRDLRYHRRYAPHSVRKL